jgi:hypothetical protein
MASFWDDVKSAIVDGYVYAADKAEELTQIGRAKVEILRLNREIARAMSEIGGTTFELFDEGREDSIAGDERIRKAVEDIRAARLGIANQQREIERIRAERDVRSDR